MSAELCIDRLPLALACDACSQGHAAPMAHTHFPQGTRPCARLLGPHSPPPPTQLQPQVLDLGRTFLPEEVVDEFLAEVGAAVAAILLQTAWLVSPWATSTATLRPCRCTPSQGGRDAPSRCENPAGLMLLYLCYVQLSERYTPQAYRLLDNK